MTDIIPGPLYPDRCLECLELTEEKYGAVKRCKCVECVCADRDRKERGGSAESDGCGKCGERYLVGARHSCRDIRYAGKDMKLVTETFTDPSPPRELKRPMKVAADICPTCGHRH